MKRRLMAALAGLLLFNVAFPAANAVAVEMVAIVCPAEMRSCFDEWMVHREQPGRRFVFIEPSACETRLRELGEARQQPTSNELTLLLIGDGTEAGVRPKTCPTRVVGRYGPETTFVTDNAYADLAEATRVGRLPFNSPDRLRRYLRRVIDRGDADVTWSDARLQIAAGVGGFSPLIDAAIEGAATSVVGRFASPASTIELTRYGVVSGPTPKTESTARGGVWVWLGHGLRDRLPGIEPGRVARATRGADVAVLLACYAGDFSLRRDCIAEQLLKADDGPLAVVASTRVSMPYGNARLGAELLLGHSAASAETTVGDLFSDALRDSIEETTAPDLAGLDPLARLMGPAGHDLRDERLDHAAMYHLLGDPLLAVNRFVPMSIDVSPSIEAHQGLTVRGVAPIGGRLRVEVLKRGKRPTAELREDLPIQAGDHFAIGLPADADWKHGQRAVRVGIEGEGQLAIAATQVTRTRSQSTRVATRTATTLRK